MHAVTMLRFGLPIQGKDNCNNIIQLHKTDSNCQVYIFYIPIYPSTVQFSHYYI